jgi:hypothetical protein
MDEVEHSPARAGQRMLIFFAVIRPERRKMKVLLFEIIWGLDYGFIGIDFRN